MSLTKVYDAPTVFKALNGILNIYKPAGMKVKHVKAAILHNICKDLNEMRLREPRKLATPLLEPGGASNPILRKIEEMDLSDHILVTGPRYQMEDFRCNIVAGLGVHTSGVLLFGLNRGLKDSSKIQRNRPIRAYHVTGKLGVATESHFADSHIVAKAKYRHVNPDRISALASSLQASHQRKLFEICGVDIQSQAAYELACKGLVRPADKQIPLIYNIKLIDFDAPNFTLEIHAINETEDFLAAFIHDMSLEMKTVGHCSAIRCIRHGKFDVEHSLLRHGWNIRGVVKNLREQKATLEAYPHMLQQDSPELRQ